MGKFIMFCARTNIPIHLVTFTGMKALAFFLALMTVLLSVTLCCEGEGSCTGEMAMECAEHSDADQDTPDPAPPCSPFYTCGSCLGFVYQSAPSVVFRTLSFTEQDFNSFYTESLYGPYLNPPKKPPIQV